ncbi:MAG: PilZ domain-containing protein [Rhodocyclaceae bacterium]|nr:MAG: PilZ domain-containing protein [Rhodocyclaceae bacterium]
MAENRKDQRHSKRLRSVIIFDDNGKQSKTPGRTHDISTSGASIISEFNLSSPHPITVCLLLHPGDQINPPVIFEAKSKIVSSVLSSRQGGFRIGVVFIAVAEDGAKALQKVLSTSMATIS